MTLKNRLMVLTVSTLSLVGLLAAVGTADGYKVVSGYSSIKWVGKKVTGQHNGSISIKGGEVRVSNMQVVGGNFTIDTTSLVVEDLQGEYKGKLEGHLKSGDFFGTDKNPTATFDIVSLKKSTSTTGSATHVVQGNLTIKGKTRPLSFPAAVVVTPTLITAEAKNVEVDRTLYDIRYGSGKFFKGLGDKMINDLFWLDISLVATN